MASSSAERSELESGGYSVDGSEDCSLSSDEETEESESDEENSTGKFYDYLARAHCITEDCPRFRREL